MRRNTAVPATLLDGIYDAAADPRQWPMVLTQIADSVGGRGAAAFCMNPATRRTLFYQSAGLDERAMQVYLERHQANPWSTFMAAQPEGRLVPSEQVLPLPMLRQSAFYQEVLRPQRLGFNAMAMLARRPTSFMAFNVLRAEQRGPFKSRERQRIEALLPHVHRSLTLGFRVDAYHAVQEDSLDLLERMSGAAWLLDPGRGVLFANRAARLAHDLCHAAEPLLRLRDAGLQRRYASAFGRVSRGEPLVSVDLFAAGRRHLHLLVCDLRQTDASSHAAWRRAGSRVLVVITDLSQTHVRRACRMQHAFGLTPGETRVAAAALRGDDTRLIAEQLKLSPNTVKTHLKRVYCKAGAAGREQLARIAE